MKIRLIYACCASLITHSCYTPGELPETIENDYEFAIPLIDTTLAVIDFPYFALSSVLPENQALPPGTIIESGAKDSPFYLGNWTDKGQSIERVELNLNISYYRLDDGAININIYTQNNNQKEHFWLQQNHQIPTKAADYEVKLNPIASMLDATSLNTVKDAGRVYLDLGLSFDRAITQSQLATSYIRAQLSMKVKVKITMKVNS